MIAVCPLFQAANVGVKRAAKLLIIVYQAMFCCPGRGLVVFIVMVPEEDWVNGVVKFETAHILEVMMTYPLSSLWLQKLQGRRRSMVIAASNINFFESRGGSTFTERSIRLHPCNASVCRRNGNMYAIESLKTF